MVFAALFLLGFGDNCQGIGSFSYSNPLGTVTSFSEWFRNLLVNIQGVVGWLAVLMIVVGGVVYITAGGSVRQATLAKTIIVFALVGFAIAVAAPSLLREIGDIATGGVPAGPSLILNATSVPEIVGRVMNFLLTLIGMLALIGFTVGGIMFITAAGDNNKALAARRAMIYSTIAITISGTSLIILEQVIMLLEAP